MLSNSMAQNNNAVVRWSKSTAKQLLAALLKDESSCIQAIIAEDQECGYETVDRIWGTHVQFQNYSKEKFRGCFRTLKASIDHEADAVACDQAAFDKEKKKHPATRALKAGCPRWNHPDNPAKKMLEEDLKCAGGDNNRGIKKPKELRAMRPEHQDFPPEIFRNRYYRQLRTNKEKPFWVHERNRKMRKQTLQMEAGLEQLLSESELWKDGKQ